MREQATKHKVAPKPSVGTVITMLAGSEAAAAGRSAVRFYGPGPEDWDEVVASA